jgi:hypothetical protein
VTSPARKKAPARAPVRPEDVRLSKAELEFAQREGLLPWLADLSGRGGAHYGLDAWGHVVLSPGEGGKYEEHASYPMSRTCPACHYDPAEDPAWVDADGNRRPMPNVFTDPCAKCGHPPLAFESARQDLVKTLTPERVAALNDPSWRMRK